MANKCSQPDRLAADQARFFMALGAVGYVVRAAELAEVDVAAARRWVEGVERPVWTTRRSEAAAQLFAVATEALARARGLLRGELEAAPVGLREAVMVAERFFAAALKLDKDVAADGEGSLALELDGWASTPAEPAGHPAPASGATGRDSV